MGKKKEIVIEGIPADEKVLAEGMMLTMNLYAIGTHKYTKYPFKYVITDKGIWTKGRGFLFIKGKTGFLPYFDIKSFKKTNFLNQVWYIFMPANGKKPANRIYFDNPETVISTLENYIPNEDKLK